MKGCKSFCRIGFFVLSFSLTLLLISCGAASESSTATSNTSTNSSSGSGSSSLSGTVTLPSSAAAELSGLASLSSISLSNTDDVPLAGATVAAHDCITGDTIDNIPSTTTDSSGDYSLDLSNVPSGSVLKNVCIEVTKQSSDKMVKLSAFVKEKTDAVSTVDIDKSTTLIETGIQQAMLESAGPLIGSATTVPSSEIDEIDDVIDDIYQVLTETASHPHNVELDLVMTKVSGNVTYTPEELKVIQRLDYKSKKTDLANAIGGDFSTRYTEAETLFKSEIEETVAALEYPENLVIPHIPEGYDSTENRMPLPSDITLPRGTKLPRGVAIPETWDENDLPQGVKLGEGFPLPSAVGLPPEAEVLPGFNFPRTYSKGNSLPRGLKVHRGGDLPNQAVLPPDFEPVAVSGQPFVMPANKNFTYHQDFVLPKDNIDFEPNFPMPSGADIAYEPGFVMPNDVVLPPVIPKEVDDFEGTINAEIVSKLANDFDIQPTMMMKLDPKSVSIDATFMTMMNRGKAKLSNIHKPLIPRTEKIATPGLFSTEGWDFENPEELDLYIPAGTTDYNLPPDLVHEEFPLNEEGSRVFEFFPPNSVTPEFVQSRPNTGFLFDAEKMEAFATGSMQPSFAATFKDPAFNIDPEDADIFEDNSLDQTAYQNIFDTTKDMRGPVFHKFKPGGFQPDFVEARMPDGEFMEAEALEIFPTGSLEAEFVQNYLDPNDPMGNEGLHRLKPGEANARILEEYVDTNNIDIDDTTMGIFGPGVLPPALFESRKVNGFELEGDDMLVFPPGSVDGDFINSYLGSEERLTSAHFQVIASGSIDEEILYGKFDTVNMVLDETALGIIKPGELAPEFFNARKADGLDVSLEKMELFKPNSLDVEFIENNFGGDRLDHRHFGVLKEGIIDDEFLRDHVDQNQLELRPEDLGVFAPGSLSPTEFNQFKASDFGGVEAEDLHIFETGSADGDFVNGILKDGEYISSANLHIFENGGIDNTFIENRIDPNSFGGFNNETTHVIGNDVEFHDTSYFDPNLVPDNHIKYADNFDQGDFRFRMPPEFDCSTASITHLPPEMVEFVSDYMVTNNITVCSDQVVLDLEEAIHQARDIFAPPQGNQPATTTPSITTPPQNQNQIVTSNNPTVASPNPNVNPGTTTSPNQQLTITSS